MTTLLMTCFFTLLRLKLTSFFYLIEMDIELAPGYSVSEDEADLSKALVHTDSTTSVFDVIGRLENFGMIQAAFLCIYICFILKSYGCSDPKLFGKRENE